MYCAEPRHGVASHPGCSIHFCKYISERPRSLLIIVLVLYIYSIVLLERVSNTNISFKMDLPWKSIFVGALTGTTALTQLVPRLSGYKTPISPIAALFLHFFTLLILALTWKVILYPKLFSPIRHLPRPSVSRKLCTIQRQ